MAKLTTDQWLAELEAIEKATARDGGDGLSVAEWMGLTNKGVEAMRRLLGEAKRQGRLVVTKAYRENLTGGMQRVPVYKIVPKAKRG